MSKTELILNPDGSVYHLNLLPGDVAPLILLVGDPERVSRVSRHFDKITMQNAKREFITHTGRIGNVDLTVLSTGIGTDNIDIVINEVDALFNVELDTRSTKEVITPLTFIRLGTSGAIQPEIAIDSVLLSRYAIGLDAFTRMDMHHTDALFQQWYSGLKIFFEEHQVNSGLMYMGKPDADLVNRFSTIGAPYVTVTCAGFYGLQGRSVRLESNARRFFDILGQYQFEGIRVGNLEMETAGIYLLAGLLGHRALSVNTVIANRATGKFSDDPYAAVDRMIGDVLDTLTVDG